MPHMRASGLLWSVLFATSLASLPASGQRVSGSEVAARIPVDIVSTREIVLVPVVNQRYDESGRMSELLNETATSLRALGYTVRLASDTPLRATANRMLRGAPVARGALGGFAGAIGIASLLVLALADVAETEQSLRTSIYSGVGGVFEEVWQTSTVYRIDGSVPSEADPGLDRCTGNLLINGDFTEDWPIGWTRRFANADQGASVTEVVEQGSRKALHMTHRGESNVTLFQIVPVPLARLTLDVAATFVAREGGMIGFSGTGNAGLSIALLDAQKRPLGVVWIGSYVNVFEGTPLPGVPLPPQSGNRASFVRVPSGEALSRSIDLSTLVRDRMGAVDLTRVAYVGVSIIAGANDRNASAELWISSLRLNACPGLILAPRPQGSSESGGNPGRRSDAPSESGGDSSTGRRKWTSRYFTHGIRVAPYVELATLQWEGTDARGQLVFSSNPELAPIDLKVPRGPERMMMYGVAFTVPAGIGLDVGMQLHEDNFALFQGGLVFEPFLPMGSTGLRVIAGGTLWGSVARHDIGDIGPYLDGSSTAEATIRLVSYGGGADATAGFAYHTSPKFSLFVEGRYRWLRTVHRAIHVPGDNPSIGNDEINWDPLVVRGFVLRIGIGG